MTRTARRLIVAASAIPILALTGCVVSTAGNGVTFLAESSALCASPTLTDAVVGVGIEVHGSRGGTIDSVTLTDGDQTVTGDTWLLDAFPANQSTAYPADGVAGWAGRQDPRGASVTPGSHTIVVRIQHAQSAPGTVVDQVAVAYTVDGTSDTAISRVAIGFGTAADHSCE